MLGWDDLGFLLPMLFEPLADAHTLSHRQPRHHEGPRKDVGSYEVTRLVVGCLLPSRLGCAINLVARHDPPPVDVLPSVLEVYRCLPHLRTSHGSPEVGPPSPS